MVNPVTSFSALFQMRTVTRRAGAGVPPRRWWRRVRRLRSSCQSTGGTATRELVHKIGMRVKLVDFKLYTAYVESFGSSFACTHNETEAHVARWNEELTIIYFMEKSSGGLRGHAQLSRTGRLPPQVRQHLLPLAIQDALLQGLLHQMIDPVLCFPIISPIN